MPETQNSDEHTACEHPFDNHSLIATSEDVRKGGVILCPVRGCKCYSTWDAPQFGYTKDDIQIPSEDELAYYQEEIWKLGDR